jgi:hypothetical protein
MRRSSFTSDGRRELVSDVDESKIIIRTCAGRCGERLHYRLGPYREGYTQELTCIDGFTAYRGGHLCRCCDLAVTEALAVRRTWRQPIASASKRAPHRVSARARSRGRR